MNSILLRKLNIVHLFLILTYACSDWMLNRNYRRCFNINLHILPCRWFNPNTRGGVLVWSGLLTLIPVAVYNFFVSTGMDSSRVGAYVGALFVLLSNLLWASTYVFRVANKDMTYAKQLRDYENAVLQKRLEELADDEISALMEEIELEEKAGPASNRAAVGVVAGSVSTSDDQSRSIGSADTLSEGQVPVTVDSAVDSSPQSQTAGSV